MANVKVTQAAVLEMDLPAGNTGGAWLFELDAQQHQQAGIEFTWVNVAPGLHTFKMCRMDTDGQRLGPTSSVDVEVPESVPGATLVRVAGALAVEILPS
jgi:hypothetical protein